MSYQQLGKELGDETTWMSWSESESAWCNRRQIGDVDENCYGSDGTDIRLAAMAF